MRTASVKVMLSGACVITKVLYPRRETRRLVPAKRRREESPEGSNDENDPGAGNARRVRALPAADAAGSSAPPLSDLQLDRVRAGVREMVQARGWTGSGTVAALQARLSMGGHELSEAALIKVRCFTNIAHKCTDGCISIRVYERRSS